MKFQKVEQEHFEVAHHYQRTLKAVWILLLVIEFIVDSMKCEDFDKFYLEYYANEFEPN